MKKFIYQNASWKITSYKNLIINMFPIKNYKYHTIHNNN